ncbi:helix-turn-helix transcriptional regulator [uncultured Tolumonas sp.]|uniref:helix-turn-helix domain-containing protein n=1 Tax=uncultured Tolumonas sp. TaxID=263765 RepID=UPI00292F81E4|nr:helix-turn-helix transcriptional regulator [uncultured Tolumonas sp.]
MTKEEEEAIKKLFGEALRSKRNSQKLSLAKLALIAETDASYIAKVERGEMNISLTSYVNLAKSLGCSMPDFFDNEKNN